MARTISLSLFLVGIILLFSPLLTRHSVQDVEGAPPYEIDEKGCAYNRDRSIESVSYKVEVELKNFYSPARRNSSNFVLCGRLDSIACDYPVVYASINTKLCHTSGYGFAEDYDPALFSGDKEEAILRLVRGRKAGRLDFHKSHDIHFCASEVEPNQEVKLHVQVLDYDFRIQAGNVLGMFECTLPQFYLRDSRVHYKSYPLERWHSTTDCTVVGGDAEAKLAFESAASRNFVQNCGTR